MTVHISGTASSSRERPFTPGLTASMAALLAILPSAALANNYGESLAWQFKTSADRANQAAILDMIEKQRSGFYAAPIYTTTIAHQYNCSIAATATGNSNGQSAIANSPTVTGASSSAAGNEDATSIDGSHSAINGQQTNGGTVVAGVNGSTDTAVRGTASQVLNSNQANSGNQSAGVQSSNACTFAALN